MVKILALDPASKTGWAWSDGTARIEFGTWLLTDPTDSHPGTRLERLRRHIYRVHREWGVERLAAEDAAFGSVNRATQAMHDELRGVVKMVASEIGAEVVFFHPTTVKKFATGHGHADKEQMMRALKVQFDIDVKGDDDAADAIWVLKFAQQPRLPEPAKVKRKRLAKAAKKAPRLF